MSSDLSGLRRNDFTFLEMGFLSFMGKLGKGIVSGISKVAGIVGKIAPIVSKVAGIIPNPIAQGISSAAGMVGGIANGVTGVGDAILGGARHGGLEGAVDGGIQAYKNSGIADNARAIYALPNQVRSGQQPSYQTAVMPPSYSPTRQQMPAII
jgi:hypothetical protein